MHTVILSTDDTRQIVDHVGLDALMDEMIDRLERACRTFDPERTVVPPRGGFAYQEPDVGLLEWMPALQVGRRASIKIVGYHPSNPTLRGLPTIISNVGVYDTQSGHLMGLADGGFLTALRTGAASAVATRILGTRNGVRLGLIGCGAQAVSQLHAISRLGGLDGVLAYDIDAEVSRSFARRVSHLHLDGVEIRTAALPSLVREADVICTGTSVGIGQGPVFSDDGCKPWLHVNAVGSDFPGKVEVPASLLKRSLVCPDFPEQAIREGECQQLRPEEIGPSLVELVKAPGAWASASTATTVFDSTGWALEDHLALDMLLDYAGEMGLGTFVDLETPAVDPRDPYAFLRCGTAASVGAPERAGGSPEAVRRSSNVRLLEPGLAAIERS